MNNQIIISKYQRDMKFCRYFSEFRVKSTVAERDINAEPATVSA